MSEDQLSRANKAFERGNLSESERLYKLLRDSTEDQADQFTHAQGLVGLGGIASARGDYFNAMEMLHLAMEIARNTSDHRSQANALTGISEIHFARGEYEHAVRNATHAQQLAETSGNKAYFRHTSLHIRRIPLFGQTGLGCVERLRVAG